MRARAAIDIVVLESAARRSRSPVRVAMFFNGFLLILLAFGAANLNLSQSIFIRNIKLGIDSGPLVKASKGGVWPKPQNKVTNNDFFIVRPHLFQFKVISHTCDLLEKALQRYVQDLKSQEKVRRIARAGYQNDTRRRRLVGEPGFKGYLNQLTVELNNECEHQPSFDMDEQYQLHIEAEESVGKSYLFSQSVWGILRGLETFSQLVHPSSDFRVLLVNATTITDYPRFPHRGLLIDTSRHFLPMRIIYAMLDAMVMSKMNVLHWHIVDDQSFPFESKTFPDLSAKGAYAPTHVYNPENVQDVISYARMRGIRVVPEFDTPGHTRSWGEAFPNLLTECYNGDEPDGSLGPMNPISEETYDFMKEFLQEVKDTFPDPYIHLGGDEVEFACWSSNPQLREYMNKTGTTVKELEGIYVKRVIDIATNLSANFVVWQEVFDDQVQLHPNSVVQIWKGNYRKELKDVTAKGYKSLLSSCWYLDGLKSGGDWHDFYRCDPHDFPASWSQKQLVVGGEACMWGEVVDANNVLARVWPRACAAAERLWSSNASLDVGEAASRLEEHTCRMNRRRIPAQPPNGPGFCPGLDYF